MTTSISQMARAVSLLGPLMSRTQSSSLLRRSRSSKRRSDLERAIPWFAGGNITGIVVTRKTSGADRSRGHLSLQFLVRRKLAKSRLSGSEIIPEILRLESIEYDFLTDVVQSFRLPRAHSASITRPVAPGCSIGNFRGMEGTLGLVVYRDGVAHYLSCAHVLAPGGAGTSQVGDVIEQPGESGDPDLQNSIGTLSDFTRLDPNSTSNVTDAAIAQCNGVSFDRAIPEIGVASGILSSVASDFTDHTMAVIRNGIGSGIQSGNIDGFGSVSVSYTGIGPVILNNLVLYTASGAEGDSGAAVLIKGTQTVVGLHVGELGDGRSVFTPIQYVFDALGVSI